MRAIVVVAALFLSTFGIVSESVGGLPTPTATPLLCNCGLALTLCIEIAESNHAMCQQQACDDERKLIASACDGGPIVKTCAKALRDLNQCLRICRQVFTRVYRGCFSSYRKCLPAGAVPCPTPPGPH